MPDGLKPWTIANWICGLAKRGRRDHVAYVLKAWKSLPRGTYVPLTEAHIAQIKDLRERSRVGPSVILRGARHHAPDGLTLGTIRLWLKGPRPAVRRDHLEYVLTRWQEAAESAPEYVPVNAALQEEVGQAAKRRGRGAKAALIKAPGRPEGLSDKSIWKLFAGTLEEIQKEHLDFILAFLQTPPAPKPRIAETGRRGWVLLDDDALGALHQAQDRSGVSVRMLLAGADDVPRGLNGRLIDSWFFGPTKIARSQHYEWVLARWQDLAAKALSPITDEIWAKLTDAHARSGITVADLLDDPDAPDDLEPDHITGWIEGRIKSAPYGHIEFVLGRWESSGE
ncbi:hypothetical protein ACFOGJ_18050 [Marinibaculum pumilum]|uniref:Uncharacterized protein n=1 Tax=Marinibaculum pumilum TaxID=1766165 RepID=A0ABV7L3Q5_9PROT